MRFRWPFDAMQYLGFKVATKKVYTNQTYGWLRLIEEILHSWYGRYPIIYRVLYIPGGAGFLPSTLPHTCPPNRWNKHDTDNPGGHLSDTHRVHASVTWAAHDLGDDMCSSIFFGDHSLRNPLCSNMFYLTISWPEGWPPCRLGLLSLNSI